ncbi:MAG: acyltransferase family protein, partial [Prevotella sp.]
MSTTYLASKPRYEILDGLRGVAAMVVVAFHMFEAYSPGPVYQIVNHGYLSVDFFFALSGFVMAYAYDDRWNRMSTKDFFKRRLIRLHPMVVFGTVFGACLYYINAGPSFPKIETVTWYAFILAIFWCFTMLPMPPAFDMRGTVVSNPFTDPVWSLQFEYIANIIYAFVLRHLSKLMIGALCLVSAFFTVTLTMNVDLFGFLATREWAAYTVIGGWAFEPAQIFIGFVRLAYPFLVGILIARIGRFIKVSNG